MILGHSWELISDYDLISWCRRCGCLWFDKITYRVIGGKKQGTEPPCVDAPGELLDSIDLLKRATERGDLKSIRTLVRRRFAALARRSARNKKGTSP